MSQDGPTLPPLKRALAALSKMQARIDASERWRTAPVAITGLGCRLPGADGPDAFWALLREGVDAVAEVPPERWAAAEVYDPVAGAPGKSLSRWGAFVAGVDEFDADSFGIDAAEAARMDPQQRLLLESAAAALEESGWTGGDGSSRTGVYVGLHGIDYLQLQLADPESIDPYTGSGGYNSIAAGRLSYQLGLRGPCLVVDTACSSALVSLHLAVQALRTGECDAALVAGAHTTLSPLQSIIGSQMGNASPTGRIRAFDAGADGMVSGEGAGVLVLRRLSDALRDGDPIRAVVRGSALNQDGRSASLTSPSGRAQVEVMRAALSNAGAVPDDVSYVEAHASGTGLGDALEIEALAEVFGSRPSDRGALSVGSVKTNIGHLQAAGGVAGLIKAVLALEHRAIPATLHFEKLNPKAMIDPGALRIPTALEDWKRPTGGRRLAGVSAFSFSGSNAHVVIEEAPDGPAGADARDSAASPVAVPITAGSERSLRELAGAWAAAFRGSAPAPRLGDVAYTASQRRGHRAHRAVLVVRSLSELLERLDSLAAGSGEPVHVVPGRTPRLVLHFPRDARVSGVYAAIESQPAAREVLARCDELLIEHADRSILAALERREDASALADPEIADPLAFALGASLAASWKSLGARPDALWGDGIGEVAAAHEAGRIELADAIRIAAAHGRVRKAAQAPAEARETFAKALGERPLPGSAPMISTAFGGPVDSLDLDADHWVRVATGAREPASAFDAVKRDGPATVLVMAGEPAAALEPASEPGGDFRWPFVAASSAGPEADARLLDVLGSLFGRGHRVDWSALPHPEGRKGRGVRLPAHPFHRRRFWLPERGRSTAVVAERAAPPAEPRLSDPARHPLLCRTFESAVQPELRFFETEIDATRVAWLSQHRLGDACWLPEATYVEMALAAARELLGERRPAVDHLEVVAPLVFAASERRTLQLASRALEGERFELVWLSRDAAAATPTWTRHATARLGLADGQELWRSQSLAPRRMVDHAGVRARCGPPVAGEQHYAARAGGPLELGPSFRGVERLWRGPTEVLVWILCPEQVALEMPDYRYHPAALDACLQAAAAAAGEGSAYRLTGFDSWVAHEPYAAGLWSHATRRPGGLEEGSSTLDLQVTDSQGWLVLEARGLRMERCDPALFAPVGGGPGGDSATAALRAALGRGAAGERAEVLEEFLRERIGALVGLPAADLDADEELPNLGLSSTNAVEFTQELERGLGLELSPTMFWNHPALAELRDFLLERLDAVSSAGADDDGEIEP